MTVADPEQEGSGPDSSRAKDHLRGMVRDAVIILRISLVLWFSKLVMGFLNAPTWVTDFLSTAGWVTFSLAVLLLSIGSLWAIVQNELY